MRVLGLWGIHIQEKTQIVGTSGKLGCALHVRKSEGIKLFLEPMFDNIPIKSPKCSCGLAHVVFEH